MYNQEILNIFEAKYGTQYTAEVCDVISLLYDIKFNALKNKASVPGVVDLSAEYDYERDWWREAGETLMQKLSCFPKDS